MTSNLLGYRSRGLESATTFELSGKAFAPLPRVYHRCSLEGEREAFKGNCGGSKGASIIAHKQLTEQESLRARLLIVSLAQASKGTLILERKALVVALHGS